MTIYFWSDLHIGHRQPFIYKSRGYDTLEGHNNSLIKKINAVVKEEDELYLLGDLILGDNSESIEYIKRIECKNIHVIRGNHDTDARVNFYKAIPNIIEVCDGKYFKYKKFNFYLSHFPCITANYNDDKKPWQRIYCLCGHTHTTFYFHNMNIGSYDVGVDSHMGGPISIDRIISDIKDYNCLIKNSAL